MLTLQAVAVELTAPLGGRGNTIRRRRSIGSPATAAAGVIVGFVVTVLRLLTVDRLHTWTTLRVHAKRGSQSPFQGAGLSPVPVIGTNRARRTNVPVDKAKEMIPKAVRVAAPSGELAEKKLLAVGAASMVVAQEPSRQMVVVGFDLASEDTHLVEDLMLAIQLSPSEARKLAELLVRRAAETEAERS